MHPPSPRGEGSRAVEDARPYGFCRSEQEKNNYRYTAERAV